MKEKKAETRKFKKPKAVSSKKPVVKKPVQKTAKRAKTAKTAKAAKAAKPAQARPRKAPRKAPLKVATRREAAPRRRSTPRSAAAWMRIQPALWIPAIASGVFGLAVALWYSQRPADAPPPSLEIHGGATATPESAWVVNPQVPQIQEEPAAQSVVYDPFFESTRTMSLPEKVAHWSGFLSRAPGTAAQRALSRLVARAGLSEVRDSAPLVPSRFDCTTFVETVAALARSRTGEEFYRNLLAIRYHGGVPTFENRNHFPEADWIPNNEQAGILRDVTRALAGSWSVEARVESKQIDRGKWLSQQFGRKGITRELASVAQSRWQAPVEARVAYIPLDFADAVVDRIPEGTILNFVRRNDLRHPVLITHQGFVVRQGGVTYLRHASGGGKIRTVALRDYLRAQEGESRARGWPLVGINLNELKGW